jgi:predicted nucleotidyltransferase
VTTDLAPEPKIAPRFAAEARLARLVALARARCGATTEVWVFGSRARGDARPDSDWDIFLVLPDDAPDEALDPVLALLLGRDAGLAAADVVSARAADVREDSCTPNTLAFVLAREGVRVDV